MARPRRRTDSGSQPPVSELGVQVDVGLGTNILAGQPAPWTSFVDEAEYVPELTWPASVSVYDQMRTDSQISGLFSAVTFGISQLRFLIDPNGAKPEIVKAISEDLNVPIQGEDGQPKSRMKKRFAHTKHLSQALLSLIYGHMYFEQVGDIVDGKWRLRKLAVRMPHHIGEISVAPDGGLVYIRQNIGYKIGQMQPPPIPVDRLVGFVFQQEGGNWVGRSMLRDLYKNWLIKDRLLRVDAINHERAGGVPYASAAPGATPSEIDDLHQQMREFKIGDTSGGALPAGAKLNIARSAAGVSVADSIRMHDEAMARRFLLMVTSLAQGGTSLGSYALGQVFQDFFTIGQRAIVQWYVDVMNEHVIEDWVDWNYDDEELVPKMTWEGEDDVLGVEQLAALVKNDVITVDAELEDAIRYKYRLPKKTVPRPDESGDAGGQNPGAPSRSVPPAEPQPQAEPQTTRQRVAASIQAMGVAARGGAA